MSVWDRLRCGLGGLEGPPRPASRTEFEPAPATAPAAEAAAADDDGRQAAVLVLLSDAADRGGDAADDEAVEVVYIRRCDHLDHHPGQIAFPGGRLDRGESVIDAALREAAEEVALEPETAELLGRLPALFVPPSGFWLQPVVARWRTPHPLVPAEDEVTEILRVPHGVLTDAANWRVVRLPNRGAGWAWTLAQGRLLWGATAAVTVTLLDVVEPGWRDGLDAESLGPVREVDHLEALERGRPAR